jgi:hypothetical protein
MSGHKPWDEIKGEFSPEALARMSEWSERLRIATRLFAEADLTDDRHDHDELHAASRILLEADELVDDDHYIHRWIEGLMKLHNIEGNL